MEEQKQRLCIAFDFDGTLVEHAYPRIGEPKQRMFQLAKALKNRGHYIILWTCRSGRALKEAVQFCTTMGLTFDGINENPVVDFGDPKIFYNYLIDDRAVGFGYFEHELNSIGMNRLVEAFEQGEW